MNYTFGIVGFGQVGKTLATYLNQYGLLKWVKIKSKKTSKIFNFNSIPKNKFIDNFSYLDDIPSVIIICVKDNQYQLVIKELLDCSLKFKKTILIHTSGSLTKSLLAPLKNKFLSTAACHPYQTFFIQDVSILNKIAWGIDCYEDIKEDITQIIKILKGKPFFLNDNALKNKTLYHISAILSSNSLIAVLTFAKEILKELNLNPLDFLQPIVDQSINNFLKYIHNEETPLTGPVVRGELETIENHLNSLKDFENFKKAIEYIYNFILEIALDNNKIDLERYNKIKNILKTFS